MLRWGATYGNSISSAGAVVRRIFDIDIKDYTHKQEASFLYGVPTSGEPSERCTDPPGRSDDRTLRDAIRDRVILVYKLRLVLYYLMVP